MGLLEQAATDLETIAGDTTAFGRSVVVTTPEGVERTIVALTNDISLAIDPQTGQAVGGRIATVVFSAASLDAAGLSLPEGIADSAKSPWLVEFSDVQGHSQKFKVADVNPDRTLGSVVCMLEAWSE